MSLLNDLRCCTGSVVPSGSLLRDLRIDIGDTTPTAPFEPAAPEVWGCVTVTTNSYTVLQNDVFIFVNPTTPGPTTIMLPANPTCGQIFVIKDVRGDAGINPITIMPAGGALIDTFSAFLLNTNRASVMVTFNGVDWGIV